MSELTSERVSRNVPLGNGAGRDFGRGWLWGRSDFNVFEHRVGALEVFLQKLALTGFRIRSGEFKVSEAHLFQ